jgi:hypothetical protein
MTNSRILALVLLTGCLTEVTTSSRNYLGPQDSGVATNRTIADTARELTRLMEVRGFAMLDQHADAPNGELVMKFAKANRALAADKSDDALVGGRDVGSVFYVWVIPSAGGASVSMYGKPTLNGIEPCSPDDGLGLPCSKVEVGGQFLSTYMSGKNEADVVHGVLSQLQLEGYVTGPLAAAPAPAVQTAADPACLARRHAVFAQADSIPDAQARATLLQTAPECPKI